MPTILLDKKILFRSLGKVLPRDDIEKLLEYCKCEIKEEDEDYFTCEVTADRPDYFSTEGICRGLKAMMGIEKGLVKIESFIDDVEIFIDENVSNVRPYVCLATVRGVSLDKRALESIIRFQETLHETLGRNRKKASIGIYDLSKITNKIYYVVKRLEEISFIPLEKKEKLSGNRILEEVEKGIAYRHLIPKDRAPVLIDSEGKYLSMAPIINSEDAKVTVMTKDILIDSTGYDFDFIKSIVSLMAYVISFYGGKIGFVKHNYPNCSFIPTFGNRFYKLSAKEVKEIIGIEFEEGELEDILLRARFGFKKEGSDYVIEVPFYRLDVISSIDIIEDIAIVKGYENIKAEMPKMLTKSKLLEESEISSYLKEIMIGFGFQEVVNYMLCNSVIQSEKIKISSKELGLIYLENPISKEYDCIRANIFPCLLDFLSKNKNYPYPQKIFEIGDVLKFDGRIIRDRRISMMSIHSEASFEEIHSYVYGIFSSLKINFKLKENEEPFLLKGRRADLIVDDKRIGWIGELNPEVSMNFSLYLPIVASELSLNEILKLKSLQK